MVDAYFTSAHRVMQKNSGKRQSSAVESRCYIKPSSNCASSDIICGENGGWNVSSR